MSLQDDPRGSTPDYTPEGNALADLATELTTHKMSRRSFINKGVMAGVGATALGSSLLAACGGSSSSTSSGPVTIQFAALVDNTGEQTAEINKFNQMNTGKINVQYVQLPPVATDQYSKFVTAFQSGSATPDVVHIDVTWPAQFATPGWLAPLDSYVSSSYLGQFWPSAANVGKVNGHIYGIQRYMDIGMLYYRTDLVQKYGGGTPPQTRDDLQAMATKILAGESGNGIKYGYLLPGKKLERVPVRLKFHDDRTNLTRRHKGSTLETSGTFVLIRSAVAWDKRHAPPNSCLTWASATREEPIRTSRPLSLRRSRY
jgi:multiple sugar transport system substrate-binding protein